MSHIKRSNTLASFKSGQVPTIKTLKDIKRISIQNKARSSLRNLKSLKRDYQSLSPQKNYLQPQFLQTQPLDTHEQKKLILFPQKNSALLQKIKDLSNEVYVNFMILKKILKNVRRKKAIISKLYGWDNIYQAFFFIGQDIKPTLSVQSIFSDMMSQLQEKTQNKHFFDKKQKNDRQKNNQLKVLYNKMRLFNAELSDYNEKQHCLQINQKEHQINQNFKKYSSIICTFTAESPEKNKSPLKLSPLKLSIGALSSKKPQKSLRSLLERKQSESIGSLGIPEFQYKLGRDIDHLEDLLQKNLKTCNKQPVK